ncbi:MAG: thioesterase II family protein [Stellaceae bacterium]
MRPSWLTCPIARAHAAIQLVAFPHAGGGATAFYPLAGLLPEAIELRAVQLPGRETRLGEAPFTRLPPLIDALADALGDSLRVPYALFGHSLGALIAFELAREFRRRGLPPPRTLIVSGRRAPTVCASEPPLHPLPDRVFVAELRRRYDAIPQVILDEPELMALFLPVLKADFALFETHEHQDEPRLDCALGIYGGAADPQTEQMEGWAELVVGPCRRRRFEGGHFYLAEGAERRAALAAALAEDVLAAVAAP